MFVVLLVFFVCASLGGTIGSLVYRPEYYNSDVAAESARLLAQVDMSYDAEVAVYRSSLEKARSLLEVGCGPAHYSERLLQTFRDLSIVCIEVDSRFAKLATGRLKHFGTRFQLVQGDATDAKSYKKARSLLTRSSDGFDVALLRLVLQHLPGRQREVLKLVARSLLRPGGAVVALDVDEAYADILQPSFPLGDALLARMNAHRTKKGAVPDSKVRVCLCVLFCFFTLADGAAAAGAAGGGGAGAERAVRGGPGVVGRGGLGGTARDAGAVAVRARGLQGRAEGCGRGAGAAGAAGMEGGEQIERKREGL